jgi:hypothetical protein
VKSCNIFPVPACKSRSHLARSSRTASRIFIQPPFCKMFHPHFARSSCVASLLRFIDHTASLLQDAVPIARLYCIARPGSLHSVSFLQNASSHSPFCNIVLHCKPSLHSVSVLQDTSSRFDLARLHCIARPGSLQSFILQDCFALQARCVSLARCNSRSICNIDSHCNPSLQPVQSQTCKITLCIAKWQCPTFSAQCSPAHSTFSR